MNLEAKEKIHQLLKDLYFKEDYEFLTEQAKANQDIFNFIYDFQKSIPEKDRWRVLWILDHASEEHFELIVPILDDLYAVALKTTNESIIRQTMKLILRQSVNEKYAGELLERCVEWMLNPKAKISSQVLGLEFFFQVTKIYPELSTELLTYIDQILEETPSAGYKNRLLKIRKQLLKKKA